MSLFEVFNEFISFLTKGATIAPEIIQVFSLALVFSFVWFVILRPIYKLIKGRD